jgi:hypothetical protein
MHRRFSVSFLVVIVGLGFTTAVVAQDQGFFPQMPAAEPAAPAGAMVPGVAPEAAAEPGGEPVVSTTAIPRDLSKPLYGIVARWRYIMVPGWLLDAFTQKNSPLYTAKSFGLEGFRRKVDKDDPNRTWELTVGVGYQNMSPPDAYWLGKGSYKIENDTDLVQARDLSLITMDAAFVSRQYFNKYFGIHYGAGLGLGIVRGKVLRSSAQYDKNTGKFQVVSGGKVLCGSDPKSCNDTSLQQSEGPPDGGPGNAHRYPESNIPGALPIINLLLGIDVRAPLPNDQALEFRLEGGFFDAFFIGLTMGYQI